MQHTPLRLLLKNSIGIKQYLCQHYYHASHIVDEMSFYLRKKLIFMKMKIFTEDFSEKHFVFW